MLKELILKRAKILKIARIVCSLIAMVIFLAIFLLPTPALDFVTYLQLMPVGLRKAALPAVLSIGSFLLLILLTFIFGRVYCSFICPLGTLQDIAIGLSKKIRPQARRKKFTRSYRRLRYAVLAMVMGAMFLGMAIPLGLIEPFAIFGRFTAVVIKPLFVWLNNVVVDSELIESIYPLDYLPFSPILLLLGVGGLGSVMVVAFFRGRLFCNTLCPAGTLLGLMSKFSWFKLAFDADSCIECGKCIKSCKAGCIDAKNSIIDNERCVRCFNCIAVCTPNAINYSHQKSPKPINQDLSRRDFLLIGGSAALGTALLPPLLRYRTPNKNAVMPPGALNFDRFTAKCTGCQLCVSNCPGYVLKPAALHYGLSGFLQPRLDFDAGMCEYECTVCSNICPNGALIPLNEARKKLLQIGIANYSHELCVVVTDRTHCGACAEHCPTGAVHMVERPDGLTIPQVEPELCIGCGACEYICPVKPKKAIIVSGLKSQGIAEVGRSEQVIDQLKDQDFPF
jgi:ferredoxin